MTYIAEIVEYARFSLQKDTTLVFFNVFKHIEGNEICGKFTMSLNELSLWTEL